MSTTTPASESPAGNPVTDHSFVLPPKLYAGGWGFYLLCLLLVGLVAMGGYAFLQQEHHGDVITGMRSIGQGGVPWGLYIMFDVYFVGLSFAAVTLAALIRLFNLRPLMPLSRLAELVAIVTVLLGGCSVMADQGRPFKALINLPAFGRPWSPFFGTFSMIMGGYLFASLVFFYLSSRADAGHCAKLDTRWRWIYKLWALGFQGHQSEYVRHHRVSFWLALIILPLIVIAYSTLGFVFGIQGGRPGWHSALQAPAFVVLAAVSGLGVIILLAAGIRRFLHLQNIISTTAFRWLGNALWVLTLIFGYLILVEELTANYAAQSADTSVARAMTHDTYGYLFWIMIGCLALGFLLPFIAFLRKKIWIPAIVTASLLVNVAAILKRFLIIVPSQTHGMLLAYPTGIYEPTWIEYSFVVGLAAAGLLAILIFMRLFPIIPLPIALDLDSIPDTGERGFRRMMRIALFILALIAGISLMALGLASSARLGTGHSMDPLIPFSPVIFINGMGFALLSAVLYEIFPSRAKATLQKVRSDLPLIPLTSPSVDGVDRNINGAPNTIPPN